MRRVRSSNTASINLLTFALACWLCACHKWVETEPVALALQEQAELPEEERAVLRIQVEPNGSTFEGVLQQFSGDSAVFVTEGGSLGIQETDIVHLDLRASDPVATGAIVLGSVVGIAAAVVVIHDLIICDPGFSC
jgi:hypothetical protein